MPSASSSPSPDSASIQPPDPLPTGRPVTPACGQSTSNEVVAKWTRRKQTAGAGVTHGFTPPAPAAWLPPPRGNEKKLRPSVAGDQRGSVTISGYSTVSELPHSAPRKEPSPSLSYSFTVTDRRSCRSSKPLIRKTSGRPSGCSKRSTLPFADADRADSASRSFRVYAFLTDSGAMKSGSNPDIPSCARRLRPATKRTGP